MKEPGRTVACPFCSTRYFLPVSLMGEAGARVRCPSCTRTFVVSSSEALAAGEVVRPVAQPDAAPSVMEESRAASPQAVSHPDQGGTTDARAERAIAPAATGHSERAARMLEALAGRHGESMQAAAAAGRLFEVHGAEIMELFDAWRREAGRDADPAIFRHALRERWGIDLEPGGD